MENSSVAPQEKGLQYWQKVIIMLCLGWVTIWIYRSALTPLFPEIQATIGNYTNTQMGLISSCYFFGYTGMQIPAGILVDKLGKKTVLIPGFPYLLPQPSLSQLLLQSQRFTLGVY